MKIMQSLEPGGKPKFLRLLYILLPLFAIFFILSLDYYLTNKRKRTSSLPALSEKKDVLKRGETLDQIVQKNLSLLGVPPKSVHKQRDSEGIPHIMIDIPEEKFLLLQSLLAMEFHEPDYLIFKKEEREDEEKKYYLWEIKGKGNQELTFLFSCLKERLEVAEKPDQKETKNKVAIIIDDMGYSIEALDEIFAIQIPLTLSILPHTPKAEETARIAHQNRLEVMLHLPLESLNSKVNNEKTEGIILSQMNKEEILRTLSEDLREVPHASGVNNHMGSKITADEKTMRIILEKLKEENLFFIDSLTTGRSIAYKVARDLKIPTARRDVFIDGKISQDYIRARLVELFRLARKKGNAIGICHPWKETLKVLKESLPLLKKYGLTPVFVSEIVR